MLDDIIILLPSLILLVVGLFSLLVVTGLKYSLKKTTLIVVPFLFILLYVNILIFSPYGIEFFDNWSILTVFLPELIFAYFIGKRKKLSSIVAILNGYTAFYIIVLLRNVTHIYFDNIILEYVLYLVGIPLLFFYLIKFYNKFQNEIEEFIPKFLIILGIYSIFILAEFYIYRFLIQTTSQYVLRLEIFGVAIISVYIVSILFISMLLKYYKETFYKASEKDQIDKQLDAILDQYKIREEKDKELTILRHDLKHMLITTSSLIKEKKYNEAITFIDSNVDMVDANKVTKYCNDSIINAIICYYKNLCIQNKIGLKIKVRNIEKALNINSSEVAILISNCFDNAINATKKLKRNRLIEFKFINTNGNLILQTKNKYEGTIQLDKNNMPTSLRENHGIGTQSIVSFCKKHNLNLNYEIDEETFILSIIF